MVTRSASSEFPAICWLCDS
uniref:Uncharacterized protein n=1 Tax=Rhizophora mucronata TaxID=61149 RepID=A0A2P2P226_RHIMU